MPDDHGAAELDAGRAERALTRQRLTAQLLCGPVPGRPEDAVGRLLAVQAQDGRGMRLAIRARTSGVSAADVDAALTQRRSLVVSWLNRGTLQLVRAQDYRWLHALTTPQQGPGNRRRLAQEGVAPDAAELAVQVIDEQTRQGPRSRSELKAALTAAGVPTGGQALYHLLLAASLRGLVVQGPVRDGELCFASTDDWLGAPAAPLPPAQALAQLARRFLAGHGPAGAGDLATWAGIRLTDARAGLAELGDALVRQPNDLVRQPNALVRLAGQGEAAQPPAAKLLGPFDPLLHGWRSRNFVLGAHQRAVTRGGMFRPFALVDGAAVATWGLAGGHVTLRPLQVLPETVVQQLSDDAAQVQRYLGLSVTAPVVAAPGS